MKVINADKIHTKCFSDIKPGDVFARTEDITANGVNAVFMRCDDGVRGLAGQSVNLTNGSLELIRNNTPVIKLTANIVIVED